MFRTFRSSEFRSSGVQSSGVQVNSTVKTVSKVKLRFLEEPREKGKHRNRGPRSAQSGERTLCGIGASAHFCNSFLNSCNS